MKQILLSLAFLCAVFTALHGATFTVSNTMNSGAGSLRQAIDDANNTAGADVIVFSNTLANQTITVISPFLVITSDMTIDGSGAANLTISGNGTDPNPANRSRIFWIQNGTITIQNLTLADGYAKGGDGSGGGMGAGGAIFMHEGRQDPSNNNNLLSGSIDLRLVNVILKNNKAIGGSGGGTDLGGGGLGGSSSGGGGGGGVLGNGDVAGGSVTSASGFTPGMNGGIAIFGSGGVYGGGPSGVGADIPGFGGGGGATGDVGGFGSFGGGGAFTALRSYGYGGFGGGGGGGEGFGGFGGGGGGGGFGGIGGFSGFGGAGSSSGGGGGAGFGGAIFVTSGKLTLQGVTFDGNTATGGTGANNGKGYGGALFIFNKADNNNLVAPGTTNDPQVFACGSVTYTNNSAADDPNSTANNDNLYGTIVFCTTISVTSNTNPSFTGNNVTFTATVTSGVNPVTLGTVTFTEGATTLAANVALNASGQASFNTSALTEGSHIITATYSGATGFGASNGTLTQIVNKMTTVNGNTFCNTGSITFNDGGTGGFIGTAATPYPSNITVSGLSGTIQSITVDLKGVLHTKSRDIDLLLVAPTGQKFLMMTGVGAGTFNSVNNTNVIDLTLSDAAGSPLPRSSVISSGTYRPTSYESWANTFPAPAPAGPYNQAAPVGTATFASVFNGLNPNGTWQLFATDDTIDVTGSIANGWCLNFVVSQPSVNLSVSSNSGTEAGQTSITVTATASAAVTGDQTVSLGVSGTGITSGDYTLSNTTITIPSGQTTGSVTFAVVDDALVEGTETATLTISNPSSGITLGATTTQNITITDDDILRIHDIQAATHISPLNGQSVAGVPGIVTAVASNGFYLQDPNPDADDATSEGIFIFTNSAPTVAVGDAITVTGTVNEIRPGGNANNLSSTRMINPTVNIASSGNPLPAPIVLGNGGRSIPSTIIEDDVIGGNIETSNTFDPTNDGIDFYESLEGMRVQINRPLAVSPTNSLDEVWVLADNGTNATSRTARGGSLQTSTDYNPERIKINDDLSMASITIPSVNVGAELSTIVGVVNFSFGYEVLPSSSPTIVSASTLTKEVTSISAAPDKLTLSTLNVNDLDSGDGATAFNNFAAVVVTNLKAPDILIVTQLQDNNGATNSGVVDASTTYNSLIAAITAAGGPTYQYRQIDPVDNSDGGEPGGNIRQGFLFNPSRVSFVDIAGGTSTSSTTVSNVSGIPTLSASPGRIDPTNAAFNSTRKPLIGQFTFNGKTIFVIGAHLNSKGGDDPLFGKNQPPNLPSETQRQQQATIIKNFVASILAIDPNANVVVGGFLNDYEYSTPINTLEAAPLTNLIEQLPPNERYAYNFQGNSNALSHVLVNSNLFNNLVGNDIVHLASEFSDQITLHDPIVAQFNLPPNCPTLATVNPVTYSNCSGDNTSDISFTSTSNSLDVKLVYFSTQQTGMAMYTGGILIGSSTTPTGGGSPYSAAFNNLVFPANNTNAPITYYVYGILDTADPDLTDANCRPTAEYQVTVNPLLQVITLDAVVCAGANLDLNTRVTKNLGTSTFFETENDAINNVNAIPSAELTNLQLPSKTYWVRVTEGSCYQVASIIVTVLDPQLTTQDLLVCSGVTVKLDNLVTASGGTVSYHNTQAGAEMNNDLLGGNTLSILQANKTVYVRVAETMNGTTCYVTGKIELFVPNLSIKTTDIVVCKGASLDLSTRVMTTGTGILSFHNSQAEAEMNQNAFSSATLSNLMVSKTYWVRYAATITVNGTPQTCLQVASIIVTVLDPKPGIIGSDQVICSSKAPQPFTILTAASDAGGGTLTYQWESSTISCESGFTPISSAIGATYTELGLLTQNTYYRRRVFSTLNGTVCEAVSNCVTVSINALPTASISGTTSICKDGTAPIITFTGSSGTAPYTFTYTINNGSSLTVSTTGNNTSATVSVPATTNGVFTYTLISVQDASSTTCSNSVNSNNIATVTIGDCDASISDPCTCENNAPTIPNGTFSNAGSFGETITVKAPTGQTWKVSVVTGLYKNAATTQAVAINDLMIETTTGVYTLYGYHRDSIGYSISVTNGRGTTLSTGNKCYYPDPSIADFPTLISPTAVPFVVTGNVANNAAGTGTFILNGNTQAGAGSAPTTLTINPATLPLGNNTLTYSFDAGKAGSNNLKDPGCVKAVTQTFRVANCGCKDVTVTLGADCKFNLTGDLVSDGNCNGGIVRVMDSNPSNGSIIDCPGVWTYGLFDGFGNIICWGKVTAEDKTAPELVCAPKDFTLDCYDVNYVLNSKLTIGDVGTFDSPRPAATGSQTFLNAEGNTILKVDPSCTLAASVLVPDDVANLGYAYFKDNCAGCGCRVTLKWSDKVVFYSCEDAKKNGGIYAEISREWVATDCNGMSSSHTQKIYFERPDVDDFVFNATDTDLKDDYDRVVEYNSCTPDKSLIKYEDVTPFVDSYFYTEDNKRRIYLDKVECNYSVSIKDTEFPICNGKGVKIDRELHVFDWCAGGIVKTFHILIKIGDFEAPTMKVPTFVNGAPYNNPAQLPLVKISTGPMDCTAAFPISTAAAIKNTFGYEIKDNCGVANVSVSVYTKDTYIKGILVNQGPKDAFADCKEDDRPKGFTKPGDDDDDHGHGGYFPKCENKCIAWKKVDYAIVNGNMVGVPVGRHLMVIEAFDGCYNSSCMAFEFEVQDKIAPVMKCDDQLQVSLTNANGYTSGYGQVAAKDVDEGSWDNCKLAWIAVRRNVPSSCEASFIAKGYDSNGNGKLDAATASGDVSKADGIDRNGDGDIADFGEAFVIKGGKLMTPLQDIAEFFCCDLSEKVTVELWGADTADNPNTDADETNYNFCWMELAIEDKVAPTCAAPWDLTVDCDEKCLETIDDKKASVACFGDVTITSGNDCAPMDTVYTTEKKLKCGAGYIDRIWTLTKQTAKGPITITCKQRVHVRAIHEYNIVFPKDASFDCKTPIVDTVLTDELACDVLAVNVSDKRYDASDNECYKLFRTYTVINWCVYDDRCGDPLADGNVFVVNRATFSNYGKAPVYVLVRDENRNLNEEFYLSKDSIPNNADDERFFPAKCTATDEYYHAFQYTQIIKVYDSERPVVSGVRDTFCTSPTACTANITKVVTIKDNCTDKVELERQSLMIAPNQTLDASKMITYSPTSWSAKDLGKGQFEIKVSNLPEGTHDLIVVGRDECGNLSVPTRIPFVVKDCKAPAPICINGLSVDLMPDGNNGGMMTVWATDFVASKIYDCNGQGPETKDGLKLVTKYSVNRVKEPVVPTQTSISVNCADLELGFILVELHAWDEVGNHDFCVTFVEVQDNNKVCPGSVTSPISIAGTISTEGSANLQGATITLSGAGSQTATTSTNGAYAFVNLTKGGDFTVTPQLDKNHLNGVSTFDLVLIQKHILGIQALNSPYKLIAADVNNSKSISTLDMIQLRKLILNIDQSFQNNTSWRFVDAAYVFPERGNPWSANFPEVVSVNDFATSVTANFVAIKVGDVNASASVSSATSAEVRTNGAFKLNTLEQNLKVGNEYRVAFTAEDLQNIQGYQFALNLDQSKVELLDIEYGVAKAENFGIFKNEGLITTSWNGKYGPGVLFTLVLRAKADAKLSSTLILNRAVSPEAYNQNNENLGIALNYASEAIAAGYELLQNTPNPFSSETQIGFKLPKATKATLSVSDAKGALLYKVEGSYPKGENQVTLKKEQLGASGVLYYTLETAEYKATKKMVILE